MTRREYEAFQREQALRNTPSLNASPGYDDDYGQDYWGSEAEPDWDYGQDLESRDLYDNPNMAQVLRQNNRGTPMRREAMIVPPPQGLIAKARQSNYVPEEYSYGGTADLSRWSNPSRPSRAPVNPAANARDAENLEKAARIARYNERIANMVKKKPQQQPVTGQSVYDVLNPAFGSMNFGR